jgi:hypothetical protein
MVSETETFEDSATSWKFEYVFLAVSILCLYADKSAYVASGHWASGPPKDVEVNDAKTMKIRTAVLSIPQLG